MRRFTRLTNAFSKKLVNHEAAVALHFMHYVHIEPDSTRSSRRATAGRGFLSRYLLLLLGWHDHQVARSRETPALPLPL